MSSGSSDSGGGSGTTRLAVKLEEAVLGKKYYEAHQLVRTLNFRYRSCNKISDLEAILIKTADVLLETEEYESGTDVGNMLANLYLEKKMEIDEKRVNILARLVKKMRNSPERATFIGNAITWSVENSVLSGQFNYTVARIYLNENSYQEAWMHMIRIYDVQLLAEMTMEIISKSGVRNDEADLVVGILVLSLLAEKRLSEAEIAFSVLIARMSYVTPLINALRFTIEACKTQDGSIYTSLKQIYWPSFNRDPKVLRLFASLGNIIFKIPKTGKGNGLMDNLLVALSQTDSPHSANSETMTLD